MEAFRIRLRIKLKNGKFKKTTWKSFGAAGWEAAQSALHELQSKFRIKGQYNMVDWTVLDPGQAHFF